MIAVAVGCCDYDAFDGQRKIKRISKNRSSGTRGWLLMSKTLRAKLKLKGVDPVDFRSRGRLDVQSWRGSRSLVESRTKKTFSAVDGVPSEQC